MTPAYRITPRAEKDLKNIARYTNATWGKSQRNTYMRALDRCFDRLAGKPGMGRHRPDVDETYYSFLQGSHVIFYLIREGGIDIIGVPHQRMDIMNYFSR